MDSQVDSLSDLRLAAAVASAASSSPYRLLANQMEIPEELSRRRKRRGISEADGRSLPQGSALKMAKQRKIEPIKLLSENQRQSTKNSTGRRIVKQEEVKLCSTINKLLGVEPQRVGPRDTKAKQMGRPVAWVAGCCLLLALASAVHRLPVAECSPDGANLSPQRQAPAPTVASTSNTSPVLSARSDTSSEPTKPSPLGKILEAAADRALNASLAGSAGSATEQRAPSLQLLKPRKTQESSSGHSSSKHQVAAAEQQIINQHSRLHLSGGSHQRLLPTKHRDQKVVSSMLDSSSSGPATSDSRDSPLASLFGNFKAGAITSRSSIVKAISDNKLARTLSTVSKTLGGNKYVAGAAAASALAALGLTVSKFLGPYFLAGGAAYSKLGDPMLGSGSYLSPSIAAPANSYLGGADRNFGYSPAAASEPMLASGSSPAQQTNSYFFRQPASPYAYSSNEFTYDPASNSYEPSPAGSLPQGYYSSSSGSTPSDSVYLTYSPQQSQSSSQYQPPNNGDPNGGSKQQQGVDATSGHYTNYYGQNGYPYDTSNGASYAPNQPYTSESRYSSQVTFPGSQEANQEASESNSGNSGNLLGYNNQYESLMPAASIDAPSFSQPLSIAPNSKRAGTVQLKMDDATRAQLYQHLLKQRQQLMRITTKPMSTGESIGQQASGGKPNQIAGVFVPLSSKAPATEVYTSSQVGKSGRFETSAANGGGVGLYIDQGGLRGPTNNGRAPQDQQQQQQPASPEYQILQPNSAEQQHPEAKPQPSSPWRSMASEAKPSWLYAANKQMDDNNLQQQQAKQQQQDYDQQVSDSAPRTQVAGGSATNGREERQMSLSARVSRTPNQSSVKVGARRPIESSPDYVGLKGLHGGSLTASGEQQRQQQVSSSLAEVKHTAFGGEQKLLQQQQQLTNYRDIGDADSKTNLIQLNGGDNDTEDNKNSVIKLIDANSNSGSGASGGKLAALDSQYDSGLVIMSAPRIDNKQASSGEQQDAAAGGQSAETIRTGGSINHSQQQQLNHNNGDHQNSASSGQQTNSQWAGKSQLSGDFPEMGALTRSFSDFTAGD